MSIVQTSPEAAGRRAHAERLGVDVAAALALVSSVGVDSVTFVGTRTEFLDAAVEVLADGVHLLVHDPGTDVATIQLLMPCHRCGRQLRTGRIVTDPTTLLTEQHLAKRDVPTGLTRIITGILGCRH